MTNTITNISYTSSNPYITHTVSINKPKKQRKLRVIIKEPCQPIKNLDDIAFIKNYLLNKKSRYDTNKLRDYTLFVVGINLSRRIGDLLSLTVGDVLNDNYTFKNGFWMITGKTQRQEHIVLTQNTKKILMNYFKVNPDIIKDMNNNLFPSRTSKGKSMSYNRALEIMKDVEREINTMKDENYKLHISTHSLRKTKAYQSIVNAKDTYDMLRVSKALGHKNLDATMHYLGLDTEETDKYYELDL